MPTITNYGDVVTTGNETVQGDVTCTNLNVTGITNTNFLTTIQTLTVPNIATYGVTSIEGGNTSIFLPDGGEFMIIPSDGGTHVDFKRNGDVSFYSDDYVSVNVNINSNYGNIYASNSITAGSVYVSGTSNLSTVYASIYYGDGGFLSNVNPSQSLFANLVVSNSVTTTNVFVSGISAVNGREVRAVRYIGVSSSGTYTLDSTKSTNILLLLGSGFTATLNMPSNPVDGQITVFSVSGAVTLAVGSGGTVVPSFAGAATTGSAWKYVYRLANTTWYRTV